MNTATPKLIPPHVLVLLFGVGAIASAVAQAPAILDNGYRNAFGETAPFVAPGGDPEIPPALDPLLPAYEAQRQNGTAFGGFPTNGFGSLQQDTAATPPAAIPDNFPRSTSTTNVPSVVELRSAIIGRPLVSFSTSYNFGGVIPPPEKTDFGTGKPLANYYRAEPLNARIKTTVVTTGGVVTSTTTEDATAGDPDGKTTTTVGNVTTVVTIGLNPEFYWSKHARKVYATQPGTIRIKWRETASVASIEETYQIATSPDKPERTIYWTENGFNGPLVEVPTGRVKAVNIVYNSLVPGEIVTPYEPWLSGLVDFNAQGEDKRYRTLYYENNLIHAYNVQGRVFVEYLGNPRGDGTNETKGIEIVNVVKEATPGTVIVDLGEEVGHLPAVDDEGNAVELQAKILQGLGIGGQPYLHENFSRAGTRRTLYAIRETQPGKRDLFSGVTTQVSNEVLIYWLETSILDLKWPKQFLGYIQQWPADAAKYSWYARPDGGAPRSVRSVSIVGGGSGYTEPPAVQFAGGGGSGATGFAVMGAGSVIEVVVTSGGSGYFSPPTVTFTGSGSGATATASIAGGLADSLATAVQLDSANNPALVHQDDPANSQARLIPGNQFYSVVDQTDPTNRALLRFTRDDDIWFERVYSQLDPYFFNPTPLLGRSGRYAPDTAGDIDTGFANISNVMVVDPDTARTLVDGVDYTVDLVAGTIQLIPQNYVESVANLGDFGVGDTVSVRLYAAYGARLPTPPGPDWEVGSFSLESGESALPVAALDFREGDGAFTVITGGILNPWNYTPGAWQADATAVGNAQSILISPQFTIAEAGAVTLRLRHRHNFNTALSRDGGVIETRVNGGEWEMVPKESFSAGAYPVRLSVFFDNPFRFGVDAFGGKSAQYDDAPYLTKVDITFDAPTLPFSSVPAVVDADIGTRIEPDLGIAADRYGAADPVFVGHIHQPSGTAFNADAYQDPFVAGFDEAAKGAIIGINNLAGNDQLEVWWYKKSTPRGTSITGTYWPSFVQRYQLRWPASPSSIVLASNTGSDDLTSLEAAGVIYFQNNPALLGFNPNEEHALMLNSRAWALRDDLNQEDSSEAYVLLQYTEADSRPSMRVFQVLREDPGHSFDYPATAGVPIQSPMPLPLLPPPLLQDRTLSSYEMPGVPDPLTVSTKFETTDAAFAHYQKFTWTDRKGILWVFRGPHGGNPADPMAVDSPTLRMRYFYNTLPGFYYPSLDFNHQPEVGIITPYLRRVNAAATATNGHDGDPVSGAVDGSPPTERSEQPLDITFRPQWPASSPELRVGETLTLPKLGLPAVLGQSSAELIYQQSVAVDPAAGMADRRKSARLFDPTRAKVYPLGAGGLAELPDSLNTSLYLGKTYFPNLPPHLSTRLYFDPAAGADGSLVFKGLFIDEAVGEKYLQLNVMSAADVTAAKALVPDEPSDVKSAWDASIDGLATTMETFIEDPNRLGTFIVDQHTATRYINLTLAGLPFKVPSAITPPRGPTAVGPGELGEVFYSDTAVDSYAVSASGGGSGYVVLATGNGVNTDTTAGGEPVSLQVFKVNAPLYRGQLKVINSENPLDEKLTLQHTSDFAGHPEEFDFEWRYAPPVDGLPQQVYSFVRKLVVGDSASDWKLLNNPTVDYRQYRSPEAEFGGLGESVVNLPGQITIDDGEGTLADGTTLPKALLRRVFSADRRPLRLFLSIALGPDDGADVYLNHALVASRRSPFSPDTPTASVPATAPAFDPLPLVFEIDPNALVADGNPDNNVLSVELHTAADPGSVTDFNLRLEGSQEVENLTGWLPLGLEPTEVASTASTVNNDAVPATTGIVAVEGKNRHTIQGSSILTLTDNWLIMRYRAKDPENAAYVANGGWSKWTEPQLAEGWIKRVLAGINPFQQRVKDLFNHEANTSVSLVEQAGKRWEGDIALNLDNINDSGLIEIYETVLRRGKDLSITGTPAINYGGANDALLLAAGYLSDLYMILGNEAYADAANSTIAFNTQTAQGFKTQYGDVATALFAFKGQLATVLDEELSLIRGRDDFLLPGTQQAPVYNRLIWNYTRGIDSGEAIYALNYNIKDVEWDYSLNLGNPGNLPTDGIISAADAAVAYPQGHGDAYGHYLTALSGYYGLLNNPNFTWTPRIEAVLVLGTPVSVDYQDERKFAAAAAALARTASRALDLSYRQEFSASEDEDWSRFHDATTNPNTGRTRSWGTDDWASRGGQGAFFHWVTANSLLPAVDPNPNHSGIQKIDRTTVPELAEIAAQASDIQGTLDNVDAHLNPLGLAAGALTFDISPSGVDQGNTHYEQVFERAIGALQNAVSAFENANGSTQFLRQQEDSLASQRFAIMAQEQAFTNQLVELYGTPYPDDIGPGKTYQQDYAGPDLLHSMYVDQDELFGDPSEGTATPYQLWLDPRFKDENSSVLNDHETVSYAFNELGFPVKPESWAGRRATPGRMQTAVSDLLVARQDLESALDRYSDLQIKIDRLITLFTSEVDAKDQFIDETEDLTLKIERLTVARAALEALQLIGENARASIEGAQDAIVKGTPTIVGPFAIDPFAFARLTAVTNGYAAKISSKLATDVFQTLRSGIDDYIEKLTFQYGVYSSNLQFESSSRQLRYELQSTIEGFKYLASDLDVEVRNVDQKLRDYYSLQAEGERIQKQRLVFRQHAAAIIQGYRTRDFAFRAFRDEALERYDALFDLAARYTYLAARAYDYETGLLDPDGNASAAGFYEKIVQARALGVVSDGRPQFAGESSGDPGLSGVLAAMAGDWSVAKTRLGFNNPDRYRTTFSLREENFRLIPGTEADGDWKDQLTARAMDNILDDPDVRRHAMQAGDPEAFAVPGIVLGFSTQIADGYNFFGKPLAAGDHGFSPTSFATKIRSSGVAFKGYIGMDDPNTLGGALGGIGAETPDDPNLGFNDPNGLSATPYIYLIPAGVDMMRSPPLGDTDKVRAWTVEDQAIPLPFNIADSDYSTQPAWVSAASLSEPAFTLRKHQAFRAVPDGTVFSSAPGFTNARLIGRSVWNSQWKIVIPGNTLLNDPKQGLRIFLDTVKDIKLHFETYSYSGN